MKKLIFFVALLFVIVSCTVTQEYHFNNDFSGTAKSSIDMSTLIAFANAADSTGEEETSFDSLEYHLQDMHADLEKIPGISNVKHSWDENTGIMFISYDFDDIETLNVSMGRNFSELTFETKQTAEDFQYFSQKGRKLYFSLPEIQNDTLFEDSDMESMQELFKYQIKFSFDKEVKKIQSNIFELHEDRHSAAFDTAFFEVFKPGFDSKAKIKLKRR